ncbi:MAG: hypothetical protein OEY74_06630, partial [Gammaproteobacteria bacterium]|nr:hypothetical protein [Gammaproteobacteria bacterium]
ERSRSCLRAYHLSPNDAKLRILASARLRELGPELGPASEWTGAVGVRGCFDDNVALRDETGLPSTLTTESPFVDFFASIKEPYNGLGGLRFVASLFVTRNFDADEFDQAELLGGALYEWRPGDWNLQIGLHGSAGSLGEDHFDRKIGGDFQAVRYLN